MKLRRNGGVKRKRRYVKMEEVGKKKESRRNRVQ